MTKHWITDEVKKLKKKYNETDPIKLCHAMGIIVLYAPMGTYRGACKGFFLKQSRINSITINSDLSPNLQRIIAAHELGHAVLHGKIAEIEAFHDFNFFEDMSRIEYEANIFAAEFLLEDEDVLDILNYDMSFFAAAAELNVPAELLDFKFRIMKQKGFKIVDPPLLCRSNFLKDIEDEDSEYII